MEKAECLHKGIATSFGERGYLEWVTRGKITLIPKADAFSSGNQRLIACINTQYKWCTSCLLFPMDLHLDKHGLEERVSREVPGQNTVVLWITC